MKQCFNYRFVLIISHLFVSMLSRLRKSLEFIPCTMCDLLRLQFLLISGVLPRCTYMLFILLKCLIVLELQIFLYFHPFFFSFNWLFIFLILLHSHLLKILSLLCLESLLFINKSLLKFHLSLSKDFDWLLSVVDESILSFEDFNTCHSSSRK